MCALGQGDTIQLRENKTQHIRPAQHQRRYLVPAVLPLFNYPYFLLDIFIFRWFPSWTESTTKHLLFVFHVQMVFQLDMNHHHICLTRVKKRQPRLSANTVSDPVADKARQR